MAAQGTAYLSRHAGCLATPGDGFELTSFNHDRAPLYAILSHTWTDGQEVLLPARYRLVLFNLVTVAERAMGEIMQRNEDASHTHGKQSIMTLQMQICLFKSNPDFSVFD
ncbi:hypothetical protein GQ44DRAFT_723778 [Phaeosphaeriaceae sp. PMI808]|nr:hypothetical protein GQ44DRAFT_723778 [Phaeosphaeriaceae sp. PMI808]